MSTLSVFVIDLDTANWQFIANQNSQEKYEELSDPYRYSQQVYDHERVELRKCLESIKKLLHDSVETVLFYSKFNTKSSQQISIEIRHFFSEEAKISENPSLKSESISTITQERVMPIQQRIRSIFGVQSLFLELGQFIEKSYNAVIYSDNNNFFDRSCARNILDKSRNSGRTLISQRKICFLIEDLQKRRLESAKYSNQYQSYLKNSEVDLKNADEEKLCSSMTKPGEEHKTSSQSLSKFFPSDHSSEATTSTKASTNISFGENIIDRDDLSSMSGGSIVSMSSNSSQRTFEMKKIDQAFKTDRVYKSSLIDLLEKLPKYFNKAPENESVKYINSLDNLINQHLNKVEKNMKSKMTNKDKEDYFLFVRDYLIRKQITTGTILEMWATTKFGDSKDKMIQSNVIKFDFDQLDLVLSKLKASKEKFSLKGYDLKCDIKVYARVCYVVIKKILKNDLNKSEKPVTSNRRLCDNIHHTVKSYYNSKKISQDQKDLIKNDKKIKYIISEILRSRGIWKEEDKKFHINTTMIENQLNEFSKYDSAEIIRDLIRDINKVISK
ncbi:unnamed protein product [Moneuplotes crassus]|uniref:Uncharacterized protein n=1 Tax=Euplotes crassus TaxID=5936 RepID=A0AAD1Y308_EUPCR|nr:unnamed protein product [Moneuplotes crassus]